MQSYIDSFGGKMAAAMNDVDVGQFEDVDNFKHVYKRYKRRDRPLNVAGVINFCSDLQNTDTVETYQLHNVVDLPKFPGLKPVKEWKAYQLKQCKGFVVIKNPFEPCYQRYWVKRCLLDFPTKPNTINLDAHMERPAQIWQNSLKQNRPDLDKESLLMKLRWATLGYQYEWNTKEYFEDRKQAFPSDLALLCTHVAAALGYPSFSSEAGIVNYYRMDSTLMGHTDVSELDKAAPLISFSFGQSCIFMIGGPTKATEPIPLFLHSGDICLMTGPARLSFHAVPRILPADEKYFMSCFHNNNTMTAESKDNSMNTDEMRVGCGTNEQCELELNGKTEISRHDDQDNINYNLETEDDPYSGTTSKQEVKFAHQLEAKEKLDCDNSIVPTPTEAGNTCSCDGLQCLMDSVIEQSDWSLFEEYLRITRVNLNVRQVLKTGCSLKNSPQTIVPLPCPGQSKSSMKAEQ